MSEDRKMRRLVVENGRLYIREYFYYANTVFWNREKWTWNGETAFCKLEWDRLFGKDCILGYPQGTKTYTSHELREKGYKGLYHAGDIQEEVQPKAFPDAVEFNNEVFVLCNITNNAFDCDCRACRKRLEMGPCNDITDAIQGPPSETFTYTRKQLIDQGLFGFWRWEKLVANPNLDAPSLDGTEAVVFDFKALKDFYAPLVSEKTNDSIYWTKFAKKENFPKVRPINFTNVLSLQTCLGLLRS